MSHHGRVATRAERPTVLAISCNIRSQRMNGGETAYLQFQTHFASEARAIKSKLKLPLKYVHVQPSTAT